MTVALPAVEAPRALESVESLAAAPARRPARGLVRDYITLTKPRIIVLLEVCALAAMVAAQRGRPAVGLVVATLAGGALAAAGANAINMWFDRDIDRDMGRTCSRPIPSGRVEPQHALVFGVVLGLAAFALLAVAVNLVSALLAEAALLFYVLVYTMWLKRTSMQNIVIGGAAGAVPPLVGWAAVTGRVDLDALYLFAIVFFWTPPHFWALALLMERDYARAGVPMLPVVQGSRRTRDAIVQYSIILALVTLLPVLAHRLGWLYAGSAVVLDGVFLAGAVRLWACPDVRAAARLFHYSLLYLALVFTAVALDRVVTVP